MTRARPIPKCELRPVWTQRTARDTVVLDLPLPPSVNALYRNVPGLGRVKSRAYKIWRATAGIFANVQRPGRIVGLADVTMLLPNSGADTDNLAKAAIDAAVEVGVIANDNPRYIRHIHIRRGEAADGLVRLIFTRVNGAAVVAYAELPEVA